jgi:hypothetical protein
MHGHISWKNKNYKLANNYYTQVLDIQKKLNNNTC